MTPEKAVEIAMGPQHVRVDFEPEVASEPARSTMRATPAVVKGAPRSDVKTLPIAHVSRVSAAVLARECGQSPA